jgi:hypothetical protein
MGFRALHGIELIDCANANSKENIKVVAKLSGYGDDIEAFEQELKKAGAEIGVKIPSFSDLVEILEPSQDLGIEIRPDSDLVL